MSTNLLAQAQTTLSSLLEKLSDTQFSTMPKPSISLNQTGTIAGAAELQKNNIRLHPKLFEQNRQYFLQQVLPHELAHLVVYKYFGKVKPHGKEWQYLMQDIFHCPAHRTHKLDITQLGIKGFTYACDCGEIELSVRRHNKVKNKKQIYVCRTCKKELYFIADRVSE
ncbi:SprT family zinc-dependent metalloprotease [Agaribacter flavus]|uniref:SprT family zinc-dependent metalloprotease n=1 Tax=Agaribacter flavus TaxID=1902781 RepID=A0ABV7FPY5_9ALTE